MRRAARFALGVLLLLLLSVGMCRAARPLGFAYCDLDRLYDTLPSPFCNDAAYTPDGLLRWNGARYRHKIACSAAVIDSMALPLVALFGVENEAVVRDLSAACTAPYTYLHRTGDRRDGLDFALLYYADCFFPHYVETGGSYLYIEGALAKRFGDERPLGLLLCRDWGGLQPLVEILRRDRPQARLLVLGQFDPSACRAAGLVEATARAERAGRGNCFRRGGWVMRDRVAADSALAIRACDVFIRDWLLDPRTGEPLPTYRQRSYRGGYGSSLPVFGYLDLP